jgi:hypothetical protein
LKDKVAKVNQWFHGVPTWQAELRKGVDEAVQKVAQECRDDVDKATAKWPGELADRVERLGKAVNAHAAEIDRLVSDTTKLTERIAKLEGLKPAVPIVPPGSAHGPCPLCRGVGRVKVTAIPEGER